MAFRFLVPKHSLSLWWFHKLPSPELVSGCSTCVFLKAITHRTSLCHSWERQGCAFSLDGEGLCLHLSATSIVWESLSWSPQQPVLLGLRKCWWTWRTKPLVDMKSAAASKGHLAREEQWCDSEYVAALVLPKAKVLIRFSQLTNCISSVCCPP